MKYVVVLSEGKELTVTANDVDVIGDGDYTWFNFKDEKENTVAAFPWESVSYIYPKS